MKAWWDEYSDDINQLRCAWCGTSFEICELNDEYICEKCLKETEVEEHSSLTNEERNK